MGEVEAVVKGGEIGFDIGVGIASLFGAHVAADADWWTRLKKALGGQDDTEVTDRPVLVASEHGSFAADSDSPPLSAADQPPSSSNSVAAPGAGGGAVPHVGGGGGPPAYVSPRYARMTPAQRAAYDRGEWVDVDDDNPAPPTTAQQAPPSAQSGAAEPSQQGHQSFWDRQRAQRETFADEFNIPPNTVPSISERVSEGVSRMGQDVQYLRRRAELRAGMNPWRNVKVDQDIRRQLLGPDDSATEGKRVVPGFNQPSEGKAVVPGFNNPPSNNVFDQADADAKAQDEEEENRVFDQSPAQNFMNRIGLGGGGGGPAPRGDRNASERIGASETIASRARRGIGAGLGAAAGSAAAAAALVAGLLQPSPNDAISQNPGKQYKTPYDDYDADDVDGETADVGERAEDIIDESGNTMGVRRRQQAGMEELSRCVIMGSNWLRPWLNKPVIEPFGAVKRKRKTRSDKGSTHKKLRLSEVIERERESERVKEIEKEKQPIPAPTPPVQVEADYTLRAEAPSGMISNAVKTAFQVASNARRARYTGDKSVRQLHHGELHYGMHSFTGPGTRTDLAEVRNFPPHNAIDACSRQHDFAYHEAWDEMPHKRQRMIQDADVAAVMCYDEHPKEDGYRVARHGIKAKVKLEGLLGSFL